MQEPNCDMPWEIYLDWLADQGIDDLRFVPINSVMPCWPIYSHVSVGNGGLDEFYYSSWAQQHQLGDGCNYGSFGQGYGVDSYYHLDEIDFYIIEEGGISETMRMNRGDGIDQEGEVGNGVGNLQ